MEQAYGERLAAAEARLRAHEKQDDDRFGQLRHVLERVDEKVDGIARSVAVLENVRPVARKTAARWSAAVGGLLVGGLEVARQLGWLS